MRTLLIVGALLGAVLASSCSRDSKQAQQTQVPQFVGSAPQAHSDSRFSVYGYILLVIAYRDIPRVDIYDPNLSRTIKIKSQPDPNDGTQIVTNYIACTGAKCIRLQIHTVVRENGRDSDYHAPGDMVIHWCAFNRSVMPTCQFKGPANFGHDWHGAWRDFS
jgi:hypothetical protein